MENTKVKWSGTAIATLVLGILGFFGLYLLSYASLLVGIGGILDSHTNGKKGLTMAIVGMVLGLLGVVANIGQHFF